MKGGNTIESEARAWGARLDNMKGGNTIESEARAWGARLDIMKGGNTLESEARLWRERGKATKSEVKTKNKGGSSISQA
jgi:hypothetical protein